MRGSTLIVVVVAMVVVGLIAVSVIAFTGREREAAASYSRREELMSCAEASRNYLIARLRGVGVVPSSIRFADPLLDNSVAADRSVLSTGHYGQSNVVSAEVVSAGVGASASGTRDLTNLLAAQTLGGQYYRVVTHCRSRGKAQEIEFLIKWGI